MQKDTLLNIPMNVEVYSSNAAGVGEHPDILEAVEKELEIIAKYSDQPKLLKNTLVENNL